MDIFFGRTKKMIKNDEIKSDKIQNNAFFSLYIYIYLNRSNSCSCDCETRAGNMGNDDISIFLPIFFVVYYILYIIYYINRNERERERERKNCLFNLLDELITITLLL